MPSPYATTYNNSVYSLWNLNKPFFFKVEKGYYDLKTIQKDLNKVNKYL